MSKERTGKQLLLHREHGIKYYCCSECGENDCKTNYCRKCGVKFTSHGAIIIKRNTETCVSCGEIIPEGRQVCPKCETGGSDV